MLRHDAPALGPAQRIPRFPDSAVAEAPPESGFALLPAQYFEAAAADRVGKTRLVPRLGDERFEECGRASEFGDRALVRVIGGGR